MKNKHTKYDLDIFISMRNREGANHGIARTIFDPVKFNQTPCIYLQSNVFYTSQTAKIPQQKILGSSRVNLTGRIVTNSILFIKQIPRYTWILIILYFD